MADSILVDNSFISTGTDIGQTGDISIKAPNVELRGEEIHSQGSGTGEADSGDIFIEADRLTLLGDCQICTETFLGESGDISINVTDSITLSGPGNVISTVNLETFSNSGSISIKTNELNLSNENGVIDIPTSCTGLVGDNISSTSFIGTSTTNTEAGSIDLQIGERTRLSGNVGIVSIAEPLNFRV